MKKWVLLILVAVVGYSWGYGFVRWGHLVLMSEFRWNSHVWGAIISALGGVCLTAYGYGWLIPSQAERFGRGWIISMKIFGPLMLIAGLGQILFSAPK
jgi:hypothetical protein